MAATAELHEAALSRKFVPEGAGPDPKIYAAVMDWRVGNRQLATMVSHEDGTTSIYLSSGAGVIGAGTIDDVQAIAAKFRNACERLQDDFHPVDTWPPPPKRSCVFYLVKRDQTLVSKIFLTKDIAKPQHRFHEVHYIAHRLFTAIRTAKPQHDKNAASVG